MPTPRRSNRLQERSNSGSKVVSKDQPLPTLRSRSRSRSRSNRQVSQHSMRSIAAQNQPKNEKFTDLEKGLAEGYENSRVPNTRNSSNLPISEKINILLLFLLYTLQGIPMGLCQSLPLFLKDRGASYDALTLLTLASTPFSLKLLWAPLVDTVFIKRFGRRKTWLVPIQLLTGILMMSCSDHVVRWIGGDVNAGVTNEQPNIIPLTIFFTSIYFLMATQDIAVDGWALTMLSPENVGYASTANSIGQNFGQFIANQGFISLSDTTWCHRFLGTPIGYSVATLSSFMTVGGVAFVVVTLIIALLKKEKQLPEAEQPDGIIDTYKQIISLMRLAPVQSLIMILLTFKAAFAPADSVAQFKMQEYGMPKADWATFSPATLVVGLVLPALIANWVSRDPLQAVSWGIPLKLTTTGLYWILVKYVQVAYSGGSRPSIGFFVCLLSWTNSLAVWATGHTTSTYADGYTVITIAALVFGLVWMYIIFPTLKRLEAVPREDWWVHKDRTAKGL
eukprot:GSChrysophyteH1.ASY1.ANO1.2772.1 assembled CDS